MRTIRQLFSLNNAYRWFHQQQIFRQGKSEILIPFLIKSMRKGFLPTLQDINNSSAIERRNGKPKAHGFVIERFIRFCVSETWLLTNEKNVVFGLKARSSLSQNSLLLQNCLSDLKGSWSLFLTVKTTLSYNMLPSPSARIYLILLKRYATNHSSWILFVNARHNTFFSFFSRTIASSC